MPAYNEEAQIAAAAGDIQRHVYARRRGFGVAGRGQVC
jgi:hypothetical protein